MKLDWVTIVYKDLPGNMMSVVHLCAYENEPKEADLESLKEELATSEEFGLIGDIDYHTMTINREESPEWFEELGIPKDSNDIDPENLTYNYDVPKN